MLVQRNNELQEEINLIKQPITKTENKSKITEVTQLEELTVEDRDMCNNMITSENLILEENKKHKMKKRIILTH